MNKILPMTLAGAMLATAAVPAIALDDKYQRPNVAVGDWMSVPDVTAKLASNGYDIREIERDDGVYEIEAMKDGARIEAHVHPATGEVLAWEHEDD